MKIIVWVDRDELEEMECDGEILAEMIKNAVGGSLMHPESGDTVYLYMDYDDVRVEVVE